MELWLNQASEFSELNVFLLMCNPATAADESECAHFPSCGAVGREFPDLDLLVDIRMEAKVTKIRSSLQAVYVFLSGIINLVSDDVFGTLRVCGTTHSDVIDEDTDNLLPQ